MENLKKLRSACSSNMSFVKQLKRDELYLKELILCTSFLDEYSPSVKQRIFHFLHDHFEVVKCKNCGNPSEWNKFDAVNYETFYYSSKNYQEYCNREECKNAKNSSRIKRQWKKMGVTNSSQLPQWKKTKIENCRKKYGTDWYNQTDEYKEKLRENSLKKYGVEHPTKLKSTQEKRIETCLEKYGVKHPSQSETVKNKTMKTLIERYGDHPLRISGTIEKRQRSGYKWKEYTFPSGKVVKIQGYENLALDELLKIYKEDDIVVENIEIEKHLGKILYENNGKISRYFPDIYIISTDTIIEVKSEWTFQNQKKINLLKEEASKKVANFKFMIF